MRFVRCEYTHLDAVLVHAVNPRDRQVHGNVLVPVAPTILVNSHHGLPNFFVVLPPSESFFPPTSFPALSVRALGQSHDNSFEVAKEGAQRNIELREGEKKEREYARVCGFSGASATLVQSVRASVDE